MLGLQFMPNGERFLLRLQRWATPPGSYTTDTPPQTPPLAAATQSAISLPNGMIRLSAEASGSKPLFDYPCPLIQDFGAAMELKNTLNCNSWFAGRPLFFSSLGVMQLRLESEGRIHPHHASVRPLSFRSVNLRALSSTAQNGFPRARFAASNPLSHKGGKEAAMAKLRVRP